MMSFLSRCRRGTCDFARSAAIKFCIAIEALLGLKFFLILLKANPKTKAVDFIYRFADFFHSPFDGIFEPVKFGDLGLIDTSIVSAAVGYALALGTLVFFINLLDS